MKSVRKPIQKNIPPKKSCEPCQYRKSDFSEDSDFEGVIRAYCSARHAYVDTQLMSHNCDFYVLNPEWKTNNAEQEIGI